MLDNLIKDLKKIVTIHRNENLQKNNTIALIDGAQFIDHIDSRKSDDYTAMEP